MKRILIICEGQTELEFCNKIIYRYLIKHDIFVSSTIIGKSGGIVVWETLKNQIEKFLFNDTNIYVTTLIDFYGIHSNHKFPNWEKIEIINNKFEFVRLIEQGMKENIDIKIQNRFVPYIQLHEFEALLFIDIKYFENIFTDDELIGENVIKHLIETNNNPETINNKKETSPSHLLLNHIKGYNKVVYGNILAEEIGIENITKKAIRFNSWINKLINIFSDNVLF